MHDAVRVLLGRVIDYAGLFPPAQLSMERAVRTYAEELRAPEKWMVARFVCPAARLAELEPLLREDFLPGLPLMLTVLGAGGGSTPAFLARIAEDAATARAFVAAHRGRVAADQFEVALPADLVARHDPDAVADVVREAGAHLGWRGAGAALAVFEAPVAGSPAAVVDAAIEGVALAGADRDPAEVPTCCFKVRCGGLRAAAIPAVEELAHVVASCRDRGVLLKATQGLHHPFRHLDREVGALAHGFVNLLVAGALARAQALDVATLAALLADEDPGHFVLAADSITWTGHRAGISEVAAGRRFGVASFGSCSLAEPVADLRALGWLGEREENGA